MKKIIVLFIFSQLAVSCWWYSFSGTSVAPDVTTISVYTIENRATLVNPALSNSLTEALHDKYRKQTRLKALPEGGDLEVEGYISSYELTSLAVTSEEVSAMNRLTITVKISYTNNKYPNENFEKDFAAFENYDSTSSNVEDRLVELIIEKLVTDIFNATVANW